MKKIALIPIDNRPVSYTLPYQIADMNSDFKLIMPNRLLLGSLVKEADTEALFEWLEDISDIDYLVISADTLIYGGLISSRRSRIDIEKAEQKIIRLRNLLLKKENCKTLLFSSIMRISNNNINEEEKEYWQDYGKKIFEYSYKLHRAEAEGNDSLKTEALKISNEIPKDILIDWLSTRARNFEINKLYLKLYDDGLIDTLIYSKDDCAEFGLNVKEAKYFEYEAETRKGIFVKTGADEIPLTLLSRCFTDKSTIKIAPIYTNPKSINKISKYEDIPLKKSVETQIITSGARISNQEEADLILYINNFEKEQGELVMNVEVPEFCGILDKFEKPCFYVDVLNANGADNNFVKQIIKTVELPKFYGYSAWNTTGNSLGSGISAAISIFLERKNKKENEGKTQAFKKMQTVRFLDDWAYQANLRKEIKEKKIKDMKEIKKMFLPYEEEIQKFLNSPKYNIDYKFPWERHFEIEVLI